MKKFVDLLISVFSMVFFFVVMYMILLKLTGHSPTLDQITVSLSVGTAVMVIRIFYSTGKFSEFISNAKENMRELKVELKEVKNELKDFKDLVNVKFEKINEDLTIIKTKLS